MIEMWRVGILAVAGCGRVGFIPIDSEASFGPWSMPTLVGELADPAADDDPTLTDDLLVIYFNSRRAGGLGIGDIWMATRASTNDPFGAPTAVVELNTASDETTPEISGDGLTIYFSSDRPGGMGYLDVYVATRPSRAAQWSAPVHVAEVSTLYADESPCVDAAGTTMFLDSERADGTYDKIYMATRPDRGAPWSAPVLRTDLDYSDEEENPFLDSNGLAIWLSVGTINSDIYIATRPTSEAPFDTFAPADAINSAAVDYDPWLSPDNRELWFASDRNGNYELYRATR